MDTNGSLAGLTIGIPAARRATETARLVQRWGGVPMVGPTVREVTAEDPAPVVDATRMVIESALHWSVHLTGVGTRRWFSLAEEAGLLRPLLSKLEAAEIVARGQKTKLALSGAGLSPVWVPKTETSDEIADWLSTRLRAGESVVVQLHGEPVPTLARAITNAKARLIQVQSYRWELPEDPGPAEQLARAIVAGQVHALVVTSAPQVRFLAEIARRCGIRNELIRQLSNRVYLAAVGTVAASGLSALGLKADLIAEPARMGALMRELAAARDQVVSKARM